MEKNHGGARIVSSEEIELASSKLAFLNDIIYKVSQLHEYIPAEGEVLDVVAQLSSIAEDYQRKLFQMQQ